MKEILIRLFLIAPLYIIWFILIFTIVVPFIYWVITGNIWIEVLDYIDKLKDL